LACGPLEDILADREHIQVMVDIRHSQGQSVDHAVTVLKDAGFDARHGSHTNADLEGEFMKLIKSNNRESR